MVRVKGGIQNRKNHRKVLGLAKGYRMTRHKQIKVARTQLSALDRRIRFLQKLLHSARVVKPQNIDRVTIGLRVTFESEGKTVSYRIVDSVQSDLVRGDLSARSPLGSALMHKQLGDVVTYDTPRGQKICTITLISYQ
jgi:transcription elongation GreA/GreB family factor